LTGAGKTAASVGVKIGLTFVRAATTLRDAQIGRPKNDRCLWTAE
jgi:hypothetical protein